MKCLRIVNIVKHNHAFPFVFRNKQKKHFNPPTTRISQTKKIKDNIDATKKNPTKKYTITYSKNKKKPNHKFEVIYDKEKCMSWNVFNQKTTINKTDIKMSTQWAFLQLIDSKIGWEEKPLFYISEFQILSKILSFIVHGPFLDPSN